MRGPYLPNECHSWTPLTFYFLVNVAGLLKTSVLVNFQRWQHLLCLSRTEVGSPASVSVLLTHSPLKGWPEVTRNMEVMRGLAGKGKVSRKYVPHYWHFQQFIRGWGSISAMWGYYLDMNSLWSVFPKGVQLLHPFQTLISGSGSVSTIGRHCLDFNFLLRVFQQGVPQ